MTTHQKSKFTFYATLLATYLHLQSCTQSSTIKVKTSPKSESAQPTPTATPTPEATPTPTPSPTPTPDPTPTPTPIPVFPTLNLIKDVEIDTAVNVAGTVVLTLSNSGTGVANSVTLDDVVSPWTLSSTTCTTSLAAAASCTITLQFLSATAVNSSVAFDVVATGTNATVQLEGDAYKPISVAAVYPVNGTKWNDYIIRANTAVDNFSQVDTTCLSNSTACFHAGTMKKSVLTGQATCSGITIYDTLGALLWLCQVESGTAVAYSYGLKDEMRLADLLEASAWKDMRLVVESSGLVTHKSPLEKWWTNTVAPLPDNATVGAAAVTLSTSQAVYTVMQNQVTHGYSITASKVAIAMPKTATLTWGTGAATGIISASSAHFLWLEGQYNALSSTGDTSGILLVNGSRSYLRSISVNTGAGGAAVRTMGFSTKQPRIRMARLSSLSSSTVTSIFGTLYDQVSVFNSTNGIYFSNGLEYVVRSNFSGITSDECALSASIIGAIHAVVHASTFANNTCATHLSGTVALSQIIAVNNDFGIAGLPDAITTSDLNNYALANTISVNNGTYGYHLEDGKAYGNIVSTNNTAGHCSVSGAASALADVSCAAQNASTATVKTDLASLASTFVGGLTSTEGSNQSEEDGLATYTTFLDFISFNNLFRGWGKLAAGFPSPANREACSTGSCQVWDYRIATGDTVLKNRSNDINATNTAFAAGQTCPSAVHGNKIVPLTDAPFDASMVTNYLINAVEIPDDPYGNDNGLCETNEACLYHPNYGSYLGEGDWLANGRCTFEDGVVTGVKMYAYPTNGG